MLQNTKPIADLQNYFAKDMERVLAIIKSLAASQYTVLIEEISNHLVDAGGKRLRPILVLSFATLCQNNSHINMTESSYHIAAAVELIHAATLLHDDVIDESLLRRGRETAKAIWGNKHSILVGDYLFSQAFCLMVQGGSLEILKILADTSATIAESEVWQLTLYNNMNSAQSAYWQLIAAKTASLFAAACSSGAILAGSSPSVVQAAAKFGHNLGMAFQIIDDLMDYMSDPSNMGKPMGGDFYEGKITAPVIAIMPFLNQEEKDKIIEIYINKDKKDADLCYIIELMQKHQVIEKTMHMTKQYVKDGIESLHNIILDLNIKQPQHDELAKLLHNLLNMYNYS